MTHRNSLLAVAAALVATQVLSGGTTIVEDFEDGTNEAGWTWGTGNELIVPDFGNPDAYLTDLTLVTFTPIASTGLGVSSEFTGNYRQRGVISVGIDLIIFDSNLPYGNRPLTLILYNYNGTPFNFDDDFGAFFIGDKDVPDPGGAPASSPSPRPPIRAGSPSGSTAGPPVTPRGTS
jgi:hypothetical protein